MQSFRKGGGGREKQEGIFLLMRSIDVCPSLSSATHTESPELNLEFQKELEDWKICNIFSSEYSVASADEVLPLGQGSKLTVANVQFATG